MNDISFCTCPNSSGERFGSFHHDTKDIFIDLKVIAYEFDIEIGDKFIRALSRVINHEIMHKVLDEFISESVSRDYDNIDTYEKVIEDLR